MRDVYGAGEGIADGFFGMMQAGKPAVVFNT